MTTRGTIQKGSAGGGGGKEKDKEIRVPRRRHPGSAKGKNTWDMAIFFFLKRSPGHERVKPSKLGTIKGNLVVKRGGGRSRRELKRTYAEGPGRKGGSWADGNRGSRNVIVFVAEDAA